MNAKLFWTTIPLILAIKLIGAQGYPPLINNSCWYVNVTGFTFSYDYWIVPEKDTVIAPYTYKKYIDSASGQMAGLIREDVTNKKVYRRANGVDVLMFDFTLQLSNSITLGNGLTYVVTSDDSVDIAFGMKRRSLHLIYFIGSFPLTSEYWIEGVGNWSHPLVPFFDLPSDPAYHINCSFQNDTNVYNFGLANGSSPTNCPTPPVLGMEEYPEALSILLFPNPFSHSATITSGRNFKNATLILCNAYGQEVRRIKNISGAEININRNGLQAGAYFASISEGNRTLKSLKLLISDR